MSTEQSQKRSVFMAGHNGLYLSGFSVVVASSPEEARQMLDDELRNGGLKDSTEEPYDLEEVDQERSHIAHFNNGNY